MWYGLRISSRADPDFVAAVSELLRSTTRALILTTSGVCLAWYLVASMTDWEMGALGRTFLIALAVAVTALIALFLLPRRLLAGQAAWLAGLSVAILLGIYLFRQPDLAYFLALLPLMAVVTVGWPAGLLTEGLLVVAMWLLGHTLPGASLSVTHRLGILAGGAVAGLLGWSVTRSLLVVTGWALATYERGRETVAEMREQRLELKQVQEDLVQANRELARLSDRLQAMYRVAEDARRAKEEFVANVSHELRTPLNMIIGFSELITQLPEVYSDRLPPMLLADIAAIQRNSQHLAQLVDDVLDLSQIEAGRMALRKEQASIQQIVDGAVTAVRTFFESKDLYLQTEIAEDLPPILCDLTRIRQVLLNLLSNAGRLTERGGVRIRARRDGNDLVVGVSDTGPGIAPADRERLFEPFQQLDGSLRRRHGGSGLGLSISKRFIEMHGGRMWLESEIGLGTTFYFSLPLEAPLPLAPAGADDARRWFSPYSDYEFRGRTRRSKAPVPAAVPRLVLLEKGEALHRLVSRYLHGVEAVPVQSPEQAVRELSHSPAQALVVNASPFEQTWAAGELRALPYDTPLITCWVPGDDEAARQLGVRRYLVKPITRGDLLAALATLEHEVERILLVDDDQEVLRLFTRMLASAGHRYHVLRANSGQRALSLMREEHPDVVLLDLIMPRMDGFQVLREKGQDPARASVAVSPRRRKRSVGWWSLEIGKYLVLIVLSASFILPLYWMAMSALKNATQVYAIPPIWFPVPPRWSNYWDAWHVDNYNLYALNTVLRYAIPVTFGAVLSNAVVAYGFSRIRWPGRDILFSVCLMTMMIPWQVTMVPLFIIFRRLGWVNSYRPLVVPAYFANAYTIFMLRQFFRTIPTELSEAAHIDGANEFTIMWRIILPLVKPALAVVALFAFMGAWNDYLGPAIYINSTSLYTLTLGLARLSASLNQVGIKDLAYPYLMAVSTVVTLPTVLIFFFAQRTFIEGIALTGIKG